MDERFTLPGDNRPIHLDRSGITLVAPGLTGRGTWNDARPAGAGRAFTGETNELDRGLAEAGLQDRHTLVLDAPTRTTTAPRGRGVGSPVADDEVLLQVPAGRNEVQFAIYKDEANIISFHYPDPAVPATTVPSRALGAARFDRFRIPLRSGRGHPGAEAGRGLFSTITSKIIKVVVLALDGPIGRLAHGAVQWWEDGARAFQGFHGGPAWSDLLDANPHAFNAWDGLEGRKSLLFIHGTTSSTAGAFGGLANFPAVLARLSRAYEGRVIGFNHHTMSASVAENIARLFDALRDHPGRYTFDVISHSRGGLVARALTDLGDAAISRMLGRSWTRPVGVSITIDRLVFVATPNDGTDLADRAKIPGFVDRITNYVNILPDSAGVIALGGVLALASAIVQVAVPALPGLADQAPGSPLVSDLPMTASGAEHCFALQANYTATGNLIDAVKDGALDRIFADKDNDLVVPTLGVSHFAGLTLPDARVKAYGDAEGVHHTNFFSHAPTADAILQFLETP